ncbi:MAG TPA: MBL fold metallo-hydrolase [Bacillales bacterium]|nr:MBL fold metallo-hydrolase [Bacillales bacterium]
MQIVKIVEMFELSAQVMGKVDTVHPTLIYDGDIAILVDTGYPGQLDQLLSLLEGAQVPLENLSKIVMTHQDIDHIGNLPGLVEARNGAVIVMADAKEMPYIQGEKPLMKVTPEAIAQIDNLPNEIPVEWREGLK